MTDIEQKALALVNEVMFSSWEYYEIERIPYFPVVCRAIEQHEQFKREVSNAVEDYCGYVPPDCPSHPITRFILPKPVDPLVEAVNEAWGWRNPHKDVADQLRAALAKRGGKIVREAE